MSFEIEGLWDYSDVIDHMDKTYHQFLAFLPTMDGHVHTVSLYINKNDVKTLTGVPISKGRPEGTQKIQAEPGVKILRRTIKIFQLIEPSDGTPPIIWADNVEIPVTRMAIPAS